MVAIHGRQCRDDRASTIATTRSELDNADPTVQGADNNLAGTSLVAGFLLFLLRLLRPLICNTLMTAAPPNFLPRPSMARGALPDIGGLQVQGNRQSGQIAALQPRRYLPAPPRRRLFQRAKIPMRESESERKLRQ